LLLLAAMVTDLTQVTGLRQKQDLVSSIQGKTNRLSQYMPRTWQNSVVLQPSELALARKRDMPP
jgi:hypothetical protein